MSKEVFLVVGYTPNFIKEEALRNLLVKLKEKNIPIFLVLHNIPDQKTLDLVDYFLYDKENPALYNYKDTHGYYFHYFKNYKIRTSLEISNYTNHGLAALKMIWLGLYNVKGLGFEKCHCIEYDTGIPDMNEINENFKLLDDYDTIAYNGFDWLNRKSLIYGQFTAYNLNAFSYEELEYSPKTEKKIKQCFLDNPPFNGMAECVFSTLLMFPKNHLFKDYQQIDKNNIIIDLSNKTPFNNTPISYRACPFWDERNNTINIFLQNESKEDILFEIYINEYQHYIPKKMSPLTWSFYPLSLSLEEIITISFSVNKKTICKYNLKEDITYEKFKTISKLSIIK